MPRNVTAGVDGSPESLAAAEWAAHEAELRGLPLHLVHAWDWQRHAQPVPAEPAHRHRGGRVLREAAERLRLGHPDLEVTSEQAALPPVTALLAASEDADALVVGSRGVSGVAGFLVGSVGLGLVARTDRPVVLVRSDARPEDEHRPDADGRLSTATPYRDVVLGLDHEQPDDSVLAFAFEAASRRGARLRVVHGASLPPSSAYDLGVDPGPGDELSRGEASAVTGVLAPWREKFPGVDIVEQAAIGDPAGHLVDAAADASLVVVGRRPLHGRLGARIGPVTHAVLHHATAPVVVVPHD
ncbi:universal stress protein [Streptomyces sp. MK5]|uniref:universal stress protein n=1 Tax=Streptomyces sp. MK5 TaxID=3064253 RepID=UPI002740367B|nr:universal stress protein [Streptomyces sp. MK5]